MSGWALQQTNNMSLPANWFASSGVTNSNGTNDLNLASPGGNLFFRLMHPCFWRRFCVQAAGAVTIQLSLRSPLSRPSLPGRRGYFGTSGEYFCSMTQSIVGNLCALEPIS